MTRDWVCGVFIPGRVVAGNGGANGKGRVTGPRVGVQQEWKRGGIKVRVQVGSL